MSNGTHLIILIFLALLSSLFSATETAYSSVSAIKLKNLAREGDRRAARVLEIINDFDRFLTTILIGNNIVNIVMTTVSTLLFTRIIGGTYGPTVSTVVITVVVLIFGEITPKMAEAVARSNAKRILIPYNHCGNVIVGIPNMSMSALIRLAVEEIKRDEASSGG